MNEQQVVVEIKKLRLGIVESKTAAVEEAIQETANAVAGSGLVLVKGSSSPSGRRSYQRLYLQKTETASHDNRTQDYRENVLGVWEWETQAAGHPKSISAKALLDVLAQIRGAVSTH